MRMNSKTPAVKHTKPFPSVRSIRRSCNRELYRTIKRLKTYISPERIEEAEKIYMKKVVFNLPFIVENGSNRKVLANWWEEEVAEEIAVLWEVDKTVLSRAFRDAFGG
jgi:hypothetical protein